MPESEGRQDAPPTSPDGGGREGLLRRVAALETRVRELEARCERLREGAEAESREQMVALRRSEERFRALVDATAQVIWTTDPAGTVVEDSPSWRAFTGQTRGDWLRRGWLAAVHLDDVADAGARWRRAIETRTPVEMECRLAHAESGEWRMMAVRIVPVLNAAGAIREWVGMSVDVSARTRSETRERGLRASVAEGERRLAVQEHAAGALRESEARFRHQALHDPLTGLANRELFHDRVAHALARAARHGTTTAVLFLDLDGFKRLNDTLGHAAGDWVLVTVAERLQVAVRADDTVARLGGDEFAVLLEGTHGANTPAEAVEVAERVVAALGVPVDVEGAPRSIPASVGIAAGDGSVSVEDLMHRADRAMYAAKARGGGRYSVAEPSAVTAPQGRAD